MIRAAAPPGPSAACSTFYFDSSVTTYTPEQYEEIYTALWTGWEHTDRWKPKGYNLNWNRTDDPLGANADGMAHDYIPDGAFATEIEISGDFQREYMVGAGALNTENMIITVTFNDGETRTLTPEEIASDVTFKGFDSSKRGDVNIVATYGGLSVSFTVTFMNPEGDITVKLTILGDYVHNSDADGKSHGFWVGGLEEWMPETEFVVGSNDAVYDLLLVAFNADASLTMFSRFAEQYDSEYIYAVKKDGVYLEEKVNGKNSGWMVCVNGRHVQVGVSKMYLADGDEIILHWCDDYVIDEGAQNFDNDFIAFEVEYMIADIGTVTADSGPAIEAARAAYDALTFKQQGMVTNYNVLLAAEAAYAEILVAPPVPRIVLVPKAKSGMEIIALDKYGEETDDPAKIVSYVVYLDASRAANSAYSFDLDYRYIDINGRESVFMQRALTYATTDKKVAAVKANADDTATVTIPAKCSGAATITATAKSLGLEASIAVYVREYSPRIETTSVTVNSWYTGGTRVRMAAGYGNAIVSAAIDSDKFEASWADGFLTVRAKGELKNGTYKNIPLTVNTRDAGGAEQSWPVTLKITVKNATPSVRIEQAVKYNNFLKNGQAVFLLSAPGRIESVSFETATYRSEFSEWTEGLGELDVTKKEDAPKKAASKGVVTVTVEGYTQPFTKKITVAAETAKPNIQLSAKSATVNTAYGSKTAYFTLYGEPFSGEPEIVITPEGAATYEPMEPYTEEGFAAYTYAITSVTGKKAVATITIRDADWADALTFKFTLNVNGKLPTAKAETGTLMLNGAYPDQSAYTSITLNTADVSLRRDGIEVTATGKAAVLEQAAKLEVTYAFGGVIARIKDPNDLPKAGTYSYKLTPVLADEAGTALKPVTVKVKVVNAGKVTATVTAKGKLDAVQRDSTAVIYTLTKIDNVMGEVTGVTLTGADADKFEAVPYGYNSKGQPQVMLTLKPGAAVSTKAKYKIALEFILDDNVELKAVTKTLTVKVGQSKLKISAVPKSATLFQGEDTLTAPAEYTLTLTSPAGARIERVELSAKTPLAFWKSLGTNAQIRWTPQSDGTVKVEIAVKDPSKVVNGKSYKVLLDVYTAGCATNVKPVTVTVSMTIKK